MPSPRAKEPSTQPPAASGLSAEVVDQKEILTSLARTAPQKSRHGREFRRDNLRAGTDSTHAVAARRPRHRYSETIQSGSTDKRDRQGRRRHRWGTLSQRKRESFPRSRRVTPPGTSTRAAGRALPKPNPYRWSGESEGSVRA